MKTTTKQTKASALVAEFVSARKGWSARKSYQPTGAHVDELGRFEWVERPKRPPFFRVSMPKIDRWVLVMDRATAKPRSVSPRVALTHVANAMAWQSYGDGEAKVDNGNLSVLLDKALGIQ